MWWVCVHSTRVRMFLRFRQGDCVLQYPSGLINLPVEYVRKKTGRRRRGRGNWDLSPPPSSFHWEANFWR